VTIFFGATPLQPPFVAADAAGVAVAADATPAAAGAEREERPRRAAAGARGAAAAGQTGAVGAEPHTVQVDGRRRRRRPARGQAVQLRRLLPRQRRRPLGHPDHHRPRRRHRRRLLFRLPVASFQHRLSLSLSLPLGATD